MADTLLPAHQQNSYFGAAHAIVDDEPCNAVIHDQRREFDSEGQVYASSQTDALHRIQDAGRAAVDRHTHRVLQDVADACELSGLHPAFAAALRERASSFGDR